MEPVAQVEEVGAYLRHLQGVLVKGLASSDSVAFTERPWQSGLGTGVGWVLEGGTVFERAGVSLSAVAAASLPAAASARRPELAGQPYRATGVSLVIHPRNPFVPTAHLNVRFFSTRDAPATWWFGGGMDLTPHYGFVEDCGHFHGTCKAALDKVDTSLHPRFKEQCDEYFHLHHRNEARGVGGVFFDDHAEGGFAAAFALMQAVGDAFLPAYLPLVERRHATPYTDAQRAHQLYRRGRYVEFNLVQDRGTLFGLQSGGQADAILMSLPPLAGWDSLAGGRDPADDTKLAEEFLPPRDWCAQD